MTVYSGERIGSLVYVYVDGRPLCPRLDLRPHSPTGFNWGYCGSGPAQLALAILAYHWATDENRALRCYQAFKERVIAPIQNDRWTLTQAQVAEVLERIEAPDRAIA